MEDKKGVIYILTNPSFPDYVKIGYADDIDKRLKQLNPQSRRMVKSLTMYLIVNFILPWMSLTEANRQNDFLQIIEHYLIMQICVLAQSFTGIPETLSCKS